MFINLSRIIKFGWQGVKQNKGFLVSVVFIYTLGVFLVSSVIFSQNIADYLVKKIKERVDIAIYFQKDTPEEKILKVKEGLYRFSDAISNIRYISQEQAYQIFTKRHEKDPWYLESLEEIGYNPFLASLEIEATNPSNYAQISGFLEEGPFKDVVERVSYYQNRTAIKRLFTLASNFQMATIIISALLAFLAFIMTFHSQRMSILMKEKEISTMKLVGASPGFIRGPFLIGGLIYGILAICLANIVIFALIYFSNSDLKSWFLGFDMLKFYQENIVLFLGIQILFVGITAFLSTQLALRRYLKI